MLAAAWPLSATAPLASLDVSLAGLRSTKGVIRVCVTAAAAFFPKCDKDPAARHLTIPADKASDARVEGLPSGAYAVSLFHDENDNGRIDTRFGIPLEGVGFSNNPRLYFGPPSFAAARIPVAGAARTMVKLRYFL